MELVAGERYLVTGDDGTVWGCGFTQPYSDAAAAELGLSQLGTHRRPHFMRLRTETTKEGSI